MHSVRQFSAFYSHFQVTYDQMTSLPGDFRWPDVTWRHSCNVTASPSELQPCRKSNVQYTQVFVLQPLPGDFRANDVTSVPLSVTWDHVTSFPVTWLPPPASYSLVRSEIHSVRQFSAFYSHFQVTYDQMTSLPGDFRSRDVTWRHSCNVTASPGELEPCRKWNVQYTQVFILLQPLPGDFRSNDVTCGSLTVT